MVYWAIEIYDVAEFASFVIFDENEVLPITKNSIILKNPLIIYQMAMNVS